MQLIVLFTVIFDPPMSFAVFSVATKQLSTEEKKSVANLAIMVAAFLSISVLFFGNYLLALFSTSLQDFRVAGGICLGLLGIKMIFGYPLAKVDQGSTGKAIAAIIATPLLTGPAAITAIIVNTKDYGIVPTGLAVIIVLGATAVLFYQADRINRHLPTTAIQVTSTILGLITLAWAVKFIRTGLGI